MRNIPENVINSLFDLIERGREGFVVCSCSMVPVLKPGDIVTVRKVSPDDVSEGDVVVYVNADGLKIVHRVVKICGGTVITAGDASDMYDDPVNISDIAGIVDHVPRCKAPARFFRIVRRLFRKIRNINR